jgi:hypothetical protein
MSTTLTTIFFQDISFYHQQISCSDRMQRKKCVMGTIICIAACKQWELRFCGRLSTVSWQQDQSLSSVRGGSAEMTKILVCRFISFCGSPELVHFILRQWWIGSFHSVAVVKRYNTLPLAQTPFACALTRASSRQPLFSGMSLCGYESM